ncbi:glutaminyl-peptide cyclotransferase-like isoform X1 [Asterias amurensis]|uniref:glutaminyl-peptide cyclotransferase-like isoform X1 n=1 Tax=Asterias amurensis TaxID=7602 RepID=UPI003AB6A0D5
MHSNQTSKKIKLSTKCRWISCCFGVVVLATLSAMVVLILFLFGLIVKECPVDEERCQLAEEVDDLDNMIDQIGVTPEPSLYDLKMDHKVKKLTQTKLHKFAAMTDINRLRHQRLPSLLIPRVSGTAGNIEVRQYITTSLQSLPSWTITEDRFMDSTPMGMIEFSNIIATLVPPGQTESDLKLVLACHHDSKYYQNQDFIGATDSSVPCAMMLDLAHNLQQSLDQKSYQLYTLQLIFFDGEEAFERWSNFDSLYGSRHLAQKWENTPHPSDNRKNVLDGIGLFFLMDLLGAANPQFVNHFRRNRQSNRMYQHLQTIETRLVQAGLFDSSYNPQRPYFTKGSFNPIEDDHKPFLQRGVDVVHMIATPFPSTWHTMSDTGANLDYPTISNLNKIIHVFVAEFLHLKLPE